MNCCDIVYQSDLYGINHKFRLQRICLDTVFLLRPPPQKKLLYWRNGPLKNRVGRSGFIYLFIFFVFCVRS